MKKSFTPADYAAIVAAAQKNYKDTNGSTKKDFDKALKAEIISAGYTPKYVHSVMSKLGAEFH